MFLSTKWSMEEQDGRERGSKDGGRVVVMHVKRGSAVHKTLPLGDGAQVPLALEVSAHEGYCVWVGNWALDRARMSPAIS